MPLEQCPKHDDTMTRIFSEIGDIKISQAEMSKDINNHIKITNDFIKKLDAVTFGNEKSDGILTKVSNLFRHQNVQWTLIIMILTSVIGYGIYLAVK